MRCESEGDARVEEMRERERDAGSKGGVVLYLDIVHLIRESRQVR